MARGLNGSANGTGNGSGHGSGGMEGGIEAVQPGSSSLPAEVVDALPAVVGVHTTIPREPPLGPDPGLRARGPRHRSSTTRG